MKSPIRNAEREGRLHLNQRPRATSYSLLAGRVRVALLVVSTALLHGCAYLPSLPGLPGRGPAHPTTPPAPEPAPAIAVVPPALIDPGAIRGRLVPGFIDGAAVDLSRVVVFADPIGERSETEEPPRATTIRRDGDSFTPALAVVSVGQTVHFRDDGELFHRIFSYSEPNAFDLGTVGSNEQKSATFSHPGLVRFYCSLHSWESGVIYVAPSPFYSTAQPTGEYELSNLPPGRYQLQAWSESVSSQSIDVAVSPGRSTSVELSVELRVDAPPLDTASRETE